MKKEISILVPAFNEVNSISSVVSDLKSTFEKSGWTYEIIVIDDGSNDGTRDAALNAGARVLSHPINVGYGGALRTGILNATYDWVGTIDSDRSYPPSEFLKLLPFTSDFDMVVGARQGKHYWGTMFKYPARLLFLAISEFVVGKKIPDVNSGLRVIQKSVLMEMLPRLSRGFSFSTTITLSFLSSHRLVRFEPIDYLPRVGSSKVRYFRDTIRTLQLMCEAIVFYNPLKAGVMLAGFPFFAGIVSFILGVGLRKIVLFWIWLNLWCWALLFIGVGFILYLLAQQMSQKNPPEPHP